MIRSMGKEKERDKTAANCDLISGRRTASTNTTLDFFSLCSPLQTLITLIGRRGELVVLVSIQMRANTARSGTFAYSDDISAAAATL